MRSSSRPLPRKAGQIRFARWILLRAAGQQFFNASPLTLGTLSDTQTAADVMNYVQAFSKDAREIFEHFHFEDVVQQLSCHWQLLSVRYQREPRQKARIDTLIKG